MFRSVFYRDFSHFQDQCRCCLFLQSADEEQHVRAFLETSDTVLSWHPKQDAILLFLPLHLPYGKFICVYSMRVWLTVCFDTVAVFLGVRRAVLCFWAQVDIRLTDIGGDSSTVAYGNRLLTAKTWHQRKQVSQAWHSVLLRGLRDRLSAYNGIITPIMSTIIPDKGEES